MRTIDAVECARSSDSQRRGDVGDILRIGSDDVAEGEVYLFSLRQLIHKAGRWRCRKSGMRGEDRHLLALSSLEHMNAKFHQSCIVIVYQTVYRRAFALAFSWW